MPQKLEKKKEEGMSVGIFPTLKLRELGPGISVLYSESLSKPQYCRSVMNGLIYLHFKRNALMDRFDTSPFLPDRT